MNNYTWTVNAIIDALGKDRALEVLKKYGGTQVYFRAIDLSEKEVDALRFKFGAGFFRLPKADQLLREKRNRQILSDRASGMTISFISRKYKLTEAGVYHILSQNKESQTIEGSSSRDFCDTLTLFND